MTEIEYQRRLARLGDRISYITYGLLGELRDHHEATIVDLSESTIYLDDGKWLQREGLEYDLVNQNVFVR